MRIDNNMPSFYSRIPQIPAAEHYSVQEPSQDLSRGINAFARPAFVVDISPEAKAAYENSKETKGLSGIAGAASAAELSGLTECQTCKNRRYQDQSDDPSVSFQTPGHISPEQSASMVLAHEYEHVSHEQAKADQEGRKVISQSVSLQSSICQECGKVYISGGTTRTVTAEDNSKVQNDDSV